MTTVLKIAQSVASYDYIAPRYVDVVDDLIELLAYLKLEPVSRTENIHHCMETLYWNLIARVADFNEFKLKQ